jgi:uncharacterized membrane protein
MMKEWLRYVGEIAVVIINVIALLIIVIGTVEAFVRSLIILFTPSPAGRQFHTAYLRYGRWLVAGLTFQIAADIIETAVAPTWLELGRLGALAVLRTFTNYFLERDLFEIEKRAALSADREHRPADDEAHGNR